MSGDEEIPVPDGDVAKKQKTVVILSDVVAAGSAAVLSNPADTGLRLMLASCMGLLERAEAELAEATKAARGPDGREE